MTGPCHISAYPPFNVTALMVLHTPNKNVLIRRVNKSANSSSFQNAPLYTDTNDSIAQTLLTPFKDLIMPAQSCSNPKLRTQSSRPMDQALAGSSPRGGRASGPNDNGSNCWRYFSIASTAFCVKDNIPALTSSPQTLHPYRT
jgi:hypothetical protein